MLQYVMPVWTEIDTTAQKATKHLRPIVIDCGRQCEYLIMYISQQYPQKKNIDQDKYTQRMLVYRSMGRTWIFREHR